MIHDLVVVDFVKKMVEWAIARATSIHLLNPFDLSTDFDFQRWLQDYEGDPIPPKK